MSRQLGLMVESPPPVAPLLSSVMRSVRGSHVHCQPSELLLFMNGSRSLDPQGSPKSYTHAHIHTHLPHSSILSIPHFPFTQFPGQQEPILSQQMPIFGVDTFSSEFSESKTTKPLYIFMGSLLLGGMRVRRKGKRRLFQSFYLVYCRTKKENIN